MGEDSTQDSAASRSTGRTVSVLRRGRAPVWRGQKVALVIGAIGLACSFAVAAGVQRRELSQARLTFESKALDVSMNLRSGFALPTEVMRTVPPLFSAAPELDRAAFKRFVTPALQRHPGLALLEWAPYVTSEDRAAFEQRGRDTGIAGFEIREPSAGPTQAGAMGPSGMKRALDRPWYLPLLYTEPYNEGVVGLDVAFEPFRRASVSPSTDEGRISATGRFELVEDPKGVYSVATFAPVFRDGAPLATQEQRRAALRGVGIGIFRLRPVVEHALEGLDLNTLDVALLDEDAPPEDRVLHETSPGISKVTGDTSRFSFSDHFAFENRHWRSMIIARVGTYPSGPIAPVPFMAGLLLTALMVGGVASRTAISRLRKAMEAAQHLGQYRLIRKLGEGGMGVVYEAHHAMLRRPTAVKLLSSAGSVTEAMLARFEREVRVTSKLTHPNTIAIYDFGRTPEGVFYYAMEFLDGITFEELVAYEGALPAMRVVHLLRQICGSLAEAHTAGLIHRDIKPANLMLCVRGGVADVVKVLDFGLVKDFSDDASKGLSKANELLGTPQYMAPEALTSPLEVGTAVDIYALGSVAYLLLTGSEVFAEGNAMQIMVQHMTKAPEKPSSRTKSVIPLELESLVMRCLEKDPALRPRSARELGKMLAKLQQSLRESGAFADWTSEDADDWWAQRGSAFLRAREARRLEAEAAKRADGLAGQAGQPNEGGASVPKVEVDLSRRARHRPS